MLLLVTSTLLQFKLLLSKRNSTVFLVQYLKAFGHITVATSFSITCTVHFWSFGLWQAQQLIKFSSTHIHYVPTLIFTETIFLQSVLMFVSKKYTFVVKERFSCLWTEVLLFFFLNGTIIWQCFDGTNEQCSVILKVQLTVKLVKVILTLQHYVENVPLVPLI